MFKVECPECSAPYQVDERRVPAAGVNMRCPKCRTAFVVHKPGDEPGDTGGKPVARESNRPRSGSQDSTTMLGVAAPVQHRAPRTGERAAAAPPPPRRVLAPPRPAPPGQSPSRRVDMKPAAPPRSPVGGSSSSQSDLDAELPAPSRRWAGSRPDAPSEELDLPGMLDDSAGLPSVVFDDAALPSVPPSDRPALPSVPPSDRPGLPSLPPRGRNAAELPRMSEPPEESFDFSFGEIDVAPRSNLPPALGPEHGAPPPRRVIPRPSATSQRQGGVSADAGELPPPQEPGSIDSVLPLSDADLSSLPPASEASPSGAAFTGPALAGSAGPSLDDALDLPSPAADFEEELARRFQPEEAGDFRLPSETPRGVRNASDAESLAAEDVQIQEVPSFDPSSLPELPDLERRGANSSGDRGGARRSAATLVDDGELADFDEGMFTLESSPPSRAPRAPQAASASSDAFDAFLEDSAPSRPRAADSSSPRDPLAAGSMDDDLSYGGAQYGEVDLSGDDSSARLDVGGAIDTDDGEFGAIPQESKPPREVAGPPSAVSPASVAAATYPVGERSAPSSTPSKRPNASKWVIGSVLAATVAGGALALVPDVGPFGVYLISDALNSEQHEQLLQSTTARAVEMRQQDSYADVPELLAVCDAASKQAARFEPLSAYASFARFSVVVRFGALPEVQSSAKVLLDAVMAKGADRSLPYVSLAHAAQAMLAGDEAGAQRAIDEAGSSIERRILEAELALQRGEPTKAVELWNQAVAELPSPWTHHGLSRGLLAQGQLDAARKQAQHVLEMNEEHAGARLVLARCDRERGQETAALSHLQALLERPALASPTETVQAHTQVGEIHLQRGRLAKAEAAFSAALAIEPKALLATVGLGETQFAAGRYAAALARFEIAARDEQGPLEAQLGLIKSFIALERLEKAKEVLASLQQAKDGKDARFGFWAGKLAAAGGENDKAEAAYRAAIEVGGDQPIVVSAYVALAQLFSQSGKLDEAQALLSEAQKRFPQSVLLRNSLGQVAMSRGRYDAALAEFRAARKLDPDDATAIFNEGSALRRLRRFEEAWKVFETVAKLDQDLPGLPLERGLLLEQSGRGKEALKEYELALSKAPDDPDLKLRVGCGRVAAGDGKAAEAILEEVVKHRARVSEVHHCLGRALFIQERYLEALKRLQEATELDPNRAEYHMFVGWVANEAGQVAQAKRALNTALALDQGLADAYWQRGVLSLRQGGPGDAIVDIKRALELKPSRHEAHADLAQAYYQMGKMSEASSHWEKALAADGDNPTWLFRYGKLLHSQHRTNEAASALEKAIALGRAADSPPAWLWEAHHLAAASLRSGPRALEHWRRFLELGPKDSPYRSDAQRALRAAGDPWQGD